MPEPEHAEPGIPSSAIQRSRRLAAAGMILGILPPVLPGPLFLIYLRWIVPIMSNYLSGCFNQVCQYQQIVEGLAFLSFLGPPIVVAGAAIVCGYIGIIHWPRYPTERLKPFNLSLALGVLWFFIFALIWGVATTLTEL